MSRSGYTDDYDEPWSMVMWRGAVESAMRGRRGQLFFRDLAAALDALPEKRLVANELETDDGAVCALGALAKARGVKLEPDDAYDHDKLGQAFDIANALAQEAMYENDEGAWRGRETDAERWTRMRAWAASKLR